MADITSADRIAAVNDAPAVRANVHAARRSVNVLGIGIDATTLPKAVQSVIDWIAEKRRTYVCVTGVHGIMESQRDPELKRIHNEAGMVTPDGMPLVYICRAAGERDCSRVYGPDLLLDVCRASVSGGYRHFFFGTTPQTLTKLTSRLGAMVPGLQIAGTYAPPFRAMTELERREIADVLNASGADIVWVGLSTPKQERWMAENRASLNAAVLIGVGAAFDFHAGTLRRAPRWIQPLCLEWLFRLVVEPRRLWKRYLVNNPQFIFALAMQFLRLKRY